MDAERLLWRALDAADDAGLAAALAAGANADACREVEQVVDREVRQYRESALHLAVRRGAAALVQRLLARGAHPDAPQARDEGAPFTIAVRNGRIDLARMLLAAGCACPAAALQQAATYGMNDLLALCREHGADLNGPPLLPFAAQAGHSSTLRWLIEHGADLVRDGAAALCAAVHGRQHSTTELLLALGVDANARTEFGWPVLHLAAYAGDRALMQRLLDAGADPDALDDEGMSAEQWFGLAE